MRTTAKRNTVLQAIEIVNKREGYNIYLNRDQQEGKYYHFTIKSTSGLPGARTSRTGRNLPSASWHAHGFIIDEIFKTEPQSVLYTMGEKFTADTWQWNDKNIGSNLEPCYFSETSIL